jgi:hypothetical protein
MAEPLSIPISSILIDAENPRLSKPNVGQREALRELAQEQQGRLIKLAEHIVEHGPNLSELPIVMPFDERRYVVLEGNRRLAAYRGLENPDSLVGALTPTLVAALRKLSAIYQQNPVESLNCLLVKDREEARPWIELRHTAGNEGAGVVKWNAGEAARFRARTVRELPPHIQVLEFLENRGDLTPEERRKAPTASLYRLFGTAAIREKLGVDIKDKQLIILGDEGKVAKALLYVVKQFITGEKKTVDIYTKDDREKYANALPAAIVVKPSAKAGRPIPNAPRNTTPKPTPAPIPKLPRPRETLIPNDCALKITDARIRAIEIELRKLRLEEYNNAVAVLYRVFVELCVDSYLTTHKLPTGERTPLTTKIQDVANDLVQHQKLNREQARPVRKAAQANSFLAPSTTLLNAYVHNQYMFPEPGDLREHWNSLQPFFIAIWMP